VSVWRAAGLAGGVAALSATPSVAQTAACGDCHPAQATAWRASQHARAFRPFRPGQDPQPPGLAAQPVAVIGVAPLQQMVVARPGGRLQVFDPALDVRTGEWFSVLGGPPPEPSAWGHWTQRGMNWNAQCATCHVTGLVRGYSSSDDTYATRWQHDGVACTACHGARERPERAMDVCLTCHSRREPLAAGFAPGEAFDAHFRLHLLDQPGLHRADGSALDEVFEGGPFLLSKMGQAGITCLDCHDPHSGATRASVDDDALCLGCHRPPTRRGATPIVVATHAPGGGRCVDCHMPERVFMQRDARRDHGFVSPAPARSALVEALTDPARSGAPDLAPALETALTHEPNAAWRASLLGLARPLARQPGVRAALVAATRDPDPRVRAAGVRTLGSAQLERPRLVALRTDPHPQVRLAAGWATRSTLAETPALRAEVESWLALSADHPAGALRLLELALAEGRLSDARHWAARVAAWDPGALDALRASPVGRTLLEP